MKVIFMFLYLVNGQVERIPVTLHKHQNCDDKFMELVKVNKEKSRVLYKNTIVWAHVLQIKKRRMDYE